VSDLSLSSFSRRITRSLRRHGFIGTIPLAARYVIHRLKQATPAARRQRAADAEFDRRFGVDTTGIIELGTLEVDGPSYDSGSRYQATAPGIVTEMVLSLGIDHKDFVFIDFGSGKGRALLVASNFPFKRVIGVEFAPALHAIAQKNIYTYRNPAQKCTDLQSECVDAALYPIPEDPIVFFFYHPFEQQIMVKVLDNIRRSFEGHPREMYLLYHNPVLSSFLDGTGFLARIKSGDDYIVYKMRQ
jgi:hypothetical protein